MQLDEECSEVGDMDKEMQNDDKTNEDEESDAIDMEEFEESGMLDKVDPVRISNILIITYINLSIFKGRSAYRK